MPYTPTTPSSQAVDEDVAEGAYADTGYYGDLHCYYGYPPYWAPGSVPPPYPYYRKPL